MIEKMKSIYFILLIPVMITLLTLTSALAGPDPVPITAHQAFDAIMTGIDPVTGVNYGAGSIAIVDVRTPSEYQFKGTAGKVDNILLKGVTAYEIDRADEQYLDAKHKVHMAGLGGFQGSVYNGVYNGYSGFHGRPTAMQPIQGWEQGKPNGPSVSWKDSGLPIFIPETSCNLREMPPTP